MLALLNARTKFCARRVSACLLLALLGLAAVTPTIHAASTWPPAVSGVTRWAVVLCKFQDTQNNPVDLQPPASFFEDLFTAKGAGKGGMYDYWKKMSYGALDLTGSTVHGWYTMPYTLAQHKQLGGPNPAGRHEKLQACIDAAQADPYFPASQIASSYYGVIAIWNDSEDTWGGAPENYFIAGAQHSLGTAAFNPFAGWEPAIVAQEMGHGYGLQHSRATDPDPAVDYMDPWDPMSAWTYGNVQVPTFPNLLFGVGGPGHGGTWTAGTSGPSLNVGYREVMGWVPASRTWTFTGAQSTVLLADVDHPELGLPVMIKIPHGPWMHTVELKIKDGWNAGISHDAVLVHELRTDGRTYIVNPNTTDRSLIAGQAFADTTSNVRVYVQWIDTASKTATVVVSGVPPKSQASTLPAPLPNGYTGSAIVSFSAASGPAGAPVASIAVASSAGSAQAVNTTISGSSGSVTVSTEGTTTLSYFATDSAGNYEYPPHIVQLEVDHTPPQTNVATVSGSGGVTVSLSALDAGAGVKQIQHQVFTLQSSGSVQTDSGSTASFAVAAQGLTDIAYWATDKVGNVEPTRLMRLEPKLVANPAVGSFASQPIGSTSQPITVILTNLGSMELTVNSYATSTEFVVTPAPSGGCSSAPVKLVPGGSCALKIHFAPSGPYPPGPRSGQLTIIHNGSNGTTAPGTTVVALSGNAIGVPSATLSTSTLSFYKQRLQTTGEHVVTLKNDGSDSLAISSIAVTGGATDYTLASSLPLPPSVPCGSAPITLAAGYSCSVSVAFTPTVTGQRVGALTFAHNAGNASGSTSTVALVGTGVVPDIALSPPSSNFGSASVGSAALTQSFTLSSTGSMSARIFGVSVGGPNATDFQIVGEQRCTPAPALLLPGSWLDSGTTCTIRVAFAPGGAGNRSASLDVQDDTPQQMHSVSLTGTGVGAVAAAVLDPPRVDIGEVAIGEVVYVEFTLTSSGTAPLSVRSVSIVEDKPARTGPSFSIVKDGCADARLDPGASCGVVVALRPLEPGDRAATLVVGVDAPVGQVTASLFSRT